jgi:hypothetical protein
MKPRTKRALVAGAALLCLGVAAAALDGGAPIEQAQEVRVGQSRILVIYYSRTGTTATLANAIAAATGADIVPIEDTVERAGAMGFLRSMRDAFGTRRTIIRPLPVDPADYELVLVGTPVWGNAAAAPVRAFFEDHRARLPAVAFFITDGLSSHETVFRDMATLAGREPVARLGLAYDDVVRGRHAGAVAAFVRALPPVSSMARVDGER